MLLKELDDYTRTLLDVGRYQDYAPNGLQVEGRAEVRTLITGVSASLALIDAALELRADAILVHHGYFWRNEDPRIVGAKRARLQRLLAHDISLLAFHLPLDGHAELGNNVQLGRVLGFQLEGWAGEQDLIAFGRVVPMPLVELAERVAGRLGRQPLVLEGDGRPIRRIAWCSGGAQGYFETAASLGVDAYLTGEVSEYNTHFARESGVALIAAGHHATERYGVQALGEHLAERFGLIHHFVEIPNPI